METKSIQMVCVAVTLAPLICLHLRYSAETTEGRIKHILYK
jgi:hypothetical protein